MEPFDLIKNGNFDNGQKEYLDNGSSRPPHISKPFVHDKAKYQETSAMQEYCSQFNITTDELEYDDFCVINEYCANHIAFFLVWLIQNGFYDPPAGFEDISQAAETVKREEITGTEFLLRYCGGILSQKDLKPEICGFVDWYYEPHYLEAYSLFVETQLHKRPLGIGFSWKEYHQFQPIIDRAYKKFLEQ